MNEGRVLRPAERWLRLLLRFYPADFREELGESVVEAYRDRCRAALGRGGAWSVAGVCMKASACAPAPRPIPPAPRASDRPRYRSRLPLREPRTPSHPLLQPSPLPAVRPASGSCTSGASAARPPAPRRPPASGASPPRRAEIASAASRIPWRTAVDFASGGVGWVSSVIRLWNDRRLPPRDGVFRFE
jgi:hypothetical protein